MLSLEETIKTEHKNSTLYDSIKNPTISPMASLPIIEPLINFKTAFPRAIMYIVVIIKNNQLTHKIIL